MSAVVAMPAADYPCALHKDHGSAKPIYSSGHHIHPIEYGGDPAGELIWICENGHQCIHAWMRAYIAGKPVPKVSRSERHWAYEGLRRAGRLRLSENAPGPN